MKIHIYSLRRLRPHVNHRRFIFHRPHKGFEHQVKHAGIGQFTSAIGAFISAEIIGAEAMFALLAVNQRIGKTLHMPGGDPDIGMHQDSRVDTLDIVAAVGHDLPPGSFDIILELHTQGAVIPAGAEPAVYLG